MAASDLIGRYFALNDQLKMRTADDIVQQLSKGPSAEEVELEGLRRQIVRAIDEAPDRTLIDEGQRVRIVWGEIVREPLRRKPWYSRIWGTWFGRVDRPQRGDAAAARALGTR